MFGFSGITAWIGSGLLAALLVASGVAYYYSGRLDTVKAERDTLQDSLDGLNKAVEEMSKKEAKLEAGAADTAKKLAAARLKIANNKGARRDETQKLDYVCPVPDGGIMLINDKARGVAASRHPG